MKEQEFGIHYKQELQSLHAPEDLITRTKKMAAEEQTLVHTKTKKRLYRYGAALSAVAAVLFLCILLLPNQPAEISSEEGTRIHLGKWEDGKELYFEEQISVDRTAILPLAFLKENAWEEEIAGVQVRFALDENESCMAAFVEDDAYVVIVSKITDKDAFRDVINKLLSE